jgi:hypothetical protein
MNLMLALLGVGVPGHMGINRNEIAHQLAKMGSSLPLIGPEPALDICEGCRRSNEGLDEQEARGLLQYIHGQSRLRAFLKILYQISWAITQFEQEPAKNNDGAANRAMSLKSNGQFTDMQK